MAYLMGMEPELTDHQIRQNNKEVRKKWEDALLKKTIKENEVEWFGPKSARKKAGPRERLAGFGSAASRAKQLKSGPRARKNYTLTQFKALTKGEVGQWVENLDSSMYRGVKHKFVRANVTGMLLIEMPNREMGLRQLGFKRKDQRVKILRALKKMEKDDLKEQARKAAEERQAAIERARSEGRDLEAEERAAEEKAELELKQAAELAAAKFAKKKAKKVKKKRAAEPTEADLAQLRANGMLPGGDEDSDDAEQRAAERRRKKRLAAEAEKRQLHSSLLKQRGRLRGKSPSSPRKKRRRDRRRDSSSNRRRRGSSSTRKRKKKRKASSSDSDSDSSSDAGRSRKSRRERSPSKNSDSDDAMSDVSC